MMGHIVRLASRFFVAGSIMSTSPALSQEMGGSLESFALTPLDSSDRFAVARSKPDDARKRALAIRIGGDPDKLCIDAPTAIAIGEALKLEETLGLVLAGSNLLPLPQKVLAKTFYDFALSSAGAEYHAETVIDNNTLLCESVIDENFSGSFLMTENAITITLNKKYSDENNFCSEINYFGDEAISAAYRRIIMSEEIVHAVQHINGMYYIYGYGTLTHRGFDALHTLVMEAHAKTISAALAVDEYMEGDGLRIDEGHLVYSDYDAAAVQMIIDIYHKHGRDAVFQDASLLYPVFISIMEDESFSDFYFMSAADDYNENLGKWQPDYAQFSQIFDELPGFAGKLGLGSFADYRSFLTSLKSNPALEQLLTQFPENPQDDRPLLVSPKRGKETPCSVVPMPNFPAPSLKPH